MNRKCLFILVILTTVFLLYMTVAIASPLQQYIENFQESDPSGNTSSLDTILVAEYSKWLLWINSFCPVWNSMIQQALKSEQTSLTQEKYIQQIEAINKITLYNCNVIYPDKPDPEFLLKNLPNNADTFKTTLSFMNTQIATIKQQTAGALQGIPPSPPSSSSQPEGFSLMGYREHFTNVMAKCETSGTTVVCSIPLTSPDAIKSLKTAIGRLKVLNSVISTTLQQELATVKAGLADLNATKQSAEDGSIVGKVNMPS